MYKSQKNLFIRIILKVLQPSYFNCHPVTSNMHYSLGKGSLASVQNHPVAFDHSIFTTYLIALFC